MNLKSEQLRRFIFNVGDSTENATAFIVSSKYAVTVEHAIVNKEKVILSNGINQLNAMVIYKSSDGDLDIDIAILKLEQEIEIDTDIGIYNYDINEEEKWFTYGYPSYDNFIGDYLNGEKNKILQVFELTEGEKHNIKLKYDDSHIDDFRGFSGAPLIIKEHIVGIINTERVQKNKAVRLTALSIKYFRDILNQYKIEVKEDISYKNLENMSDYEFELLSKDILIKDLGMSSKLRKCKSKLDYSVNYFIDEYCAIIINHDINITYTKFIGNLKKILMEVKKHNPKQIYVITSLSLSKYNVNEIYNLYYDYMNSDKNIYDLNKIVNLLKQDEYKDLVKSHYKAWILSNKLLKLIRDKDYFIDYGELMVNIEEESKYFVRTKAYYDSLCILNKEGIIIIHGNPGIGKTTLSKMLILYYINKGFDVINGNGITIYDLKQHLLKNRNKPEIIIIDDFLGQHYLKMKENKSSEIKSLILTIKLCKNKKLILNTRVTIFNEAIRTSMELENCIDDMSVKRYLIDANCITSEEKALIFYNHIYFNNLKKEYFDSVKKDKGYMSIVMHRNYNPRIIEYVTKETNYRRISCENYYNYILHNLDNPKKVWEDEFDNIMSNYDRILINTLYSLCDNSINDDILKECFYRRIKELPSYDSTKDNYEECIIRLSDSMIKLICIGNQKTIGALNPSVNDFIFNRLGKNENEIDNILYYSMYIEQLERLKAFNKEKIDIFIREKISNRQFMNMKTLNKPISYYFLLYIYENEYMNLNIKEDLISTLTSDKEYVNQGNNLNEFSIVIINLIGNKNLSEFYCLNKTIMNDDNISKILNNIHKNQVINLIRVCDGYSKYSLEFRERVKAITKEDLRSCIINDIEDVIGEIVTETLDDNREKILYDLSDKDINREKDEDDINIIHAQIEAKLLNEIEEIQSKWQIPHFYFEDIDINIEDIVSNINIEDSIIEYLAPDDDYYDGFEDHHYWDNHTNGNNYDVINDIFER